MQSTKKRQQFAISIRRKQMTQKLETLRSQYALENEPTTTQQYQKYLPLIAELQSNKKKIQECVKELKILSFGQESARLMHSSGVHTLIYGYLVEQAAKKDALNSYTYNSMLTILINLCVHIDLQIPPQIMHLVATSILLPQREIISLWFLANILYQKSLFSGAMAKQLVQRCDALEYMEARVGRKFEAEGDIVIFEYFCCGFLGVAGGLAGGEVRRIFGVIVEVLKYEPKEEENYWYLTEALVDHAPYIATTEYQLFSCEPIQTRLSLSCKTKKSRYIKNYLKMLTIYIKSDPNAYTQLLKTPIFTDLSYCLENRLPEIKKLCAEVGYALLCNFGEKVDIENIAFLGNLMVELTGVEGFGVEVQIWVVRYARKFVEISSGYFGPKKGTATSQSRQKFLQQFLSTNILTSLCKILLTASPQNPQLLLTVLSFLEILLKLDDRSLVIRKMGQQRLREYLQYVALGENNGNGSGGNGGMMKNGEVEEKVNYFLGVFEEFQESKGVMM